MGQKYIYLEHTADAKFQAFGKTLKECFENSALALCGVVADLEKVEAGEKEEIKVKGKDAEELLHNFLEEIVFLMEMKEMVFSEFDVNIVSGQQEWFLEGEAGGEKMDSEKHSLKAGIKAVTWHEYYLRKEDGLWTAQVIVDI